MATLTLKPNVRKTAPLKIQQTIKSEWMLKDTGVMVHESGFSIQFFTEDECEIVNIPKDMSFSTIRTLTGKAMARRKARVFS